MDLFDFTPHHELRQERPLAERVRPGSLGEVLGQDSILNDKTILGQQIKSKRISSVILWGPPGTGKTSLALAIAKDLGCKFININAVDTGAKQLKETGESAKFSYRVENQKTLLFIDEIHRLNKSQQDVLLPYLESGDLVLIGATTENPSYEMNRAVLSRCRVVQLKPLSHEALGFLLDRGLKELGLEVDALTLSLREELVMMSAGDGRRLLNNLEQIVIAFRGLGQPLPISKDPELLGQLQTVISYDKKSDLHYDIISAFIKSIRGSDADAALFWLARMVEGGEDPLFIARRLIILASEDIGNADPRALSIATSGLQGLEMVGMPEGGIILSQVVTYLASAPKSNASYLAWKKAQEKVQKWPAAQVPFNLRSGTQPGGAGETYKYPHDFNKGYVDQNYWPKEVPIEVFYEPKQIGFEKTIREYLKWLKG